MLDKQTNLDIFYNKRHFIKRKGKSIIRYTTAYLFILPAMLFIATIVVYPVFKSLQLSFYDWDGLRTPIFSGFDNFRYLLKDDVLKLALKNSAIYTFFHVVGTTVIGFILALIIDLKIKGWKIYKILFFLPVMYSTIVVSMMWAKIFEPNHGVINTILDLLNLSNFRQLWLGDQRLALACIIFVSIWQFCGYPMIFFLSGLKSIPLDIYDSAKVDGANTFQTIFYITIPLMSNIFIVVIMLGIIGSLKVFDTVWIMTAGGPGVASTVLGAHVFSMAFTRYSKMGYASTLSLIAFTIAIIASIIYLRYLRYEKQ